MKSLYKFIKGYFTILGKLLQEKKNILFILLIVAACFIIKPIISDFKRYLVIMFFVSWIIQYFLLLKKSYTFFIIRTTVIIFICFELFFGFINSTKITLCTYGNGSFIYQENNIEIDSLIGIRLKSNMTATRSTEILYGDTLYDVYYSSDAYGRRINDKNSLADTIPKNKHAVFMGCSITFGMGLNYSSTFPYFFENSNKEYQSYNYGYIGYGPHQNCMFFDDGINTLNNTSVPQDSGFCMYTYIDDHLERVYAGSKYLSWGFNSPDIYIENNKLVRHKRSKLKQYLAWILNNSETIKYFDIDFTYPKSEEFYKRFASIVNYTSEKYYHLKPHGKFYVSLYPMKENVNDTAWIKYLNGNITVLRIPPPVDYETSKSYIIQKDGHPTEKLNEYYERNFSKLMFKN